jgi:DNA helicase-2/ATP-dependent DNA helicase PcrA
VSVTEAVALETEAHFTESQLEAIRAIDENLQIVACAGSGKTEVVAERVAEILRVKAGDGIAPRNIVAFTFTDRAGAELKDRIVQKIHLRLGDVHGLAEMYVGTIHGYCLELLQTHMPEYFKYSVLNEVQARLLVDRSSKESGLTDPLGLKRYVESRLYLDVLSTLREGNIDETVITADEEGHKALESLEKYETLLERKRVLDYTGIMLQAVAALHSVDELRETVAERVKYLIVDEYQDVNPLQEALVRVLNDLGANVCVVGDDDQTIYQWRGSDVDNILTFADRYDDVRVVTVEENYRSSSGVVDAARRVIENNNPARLEKTMVSADTQAFERGDVLCLEFGNPHAEAGWIAEKIKRMVGTPFKDRPDAEPRGLAPSDFAILLRSVKNNGDPIVDALQHAGLRVVVVGMTTLFEQPEIEAARHLFRFMGLQDVTRKELRQAWLDADLGIETGKLDAAILMIESQREWDDDARWSVYNLQRTFLSFLEELDLREDTVPDGRGEIVFYNLGKFSQVISDFEQIHFQSDPARKYEGFAKFLVHQAPGYYPEGWQDAGYVRPDAVQVMTVHQAKGMQWPVVFVPCLLKNRFPTSRPGGKGKWHVIPKKAVKNADRYDGTTADERRLFYVALTRAQRYLFASWAPEAAKGWYTKPSEFVRELAADTQVLTREPTRPEPVKLDPRPKREVENIALSFSELKYFFECPYQFKLRFLYGFNPPLHEALGFGKSVHDALAEVHKRALAGDIVTEADVPDVVDRHLNAPFAYAELRENLRKAAEVALARYLRDNADKLQNVELVEQQVEINLGDGLVVNGRIDLIRKLDTNEIVVIDFKSSERVQSEDVTRMQLHVYALGYRELTGNGADLIERYNLDDGVPQREEVDAALEQETREDVIRAGNALRINQLERYSSWNEACDRCDLVGLCRTREAAA